MATLFEFLRDPAGIYHAYLYQRKQRTTRLYCGEDNLTETELDAMRWEVFDSETVSPIRDTICPGCLRTGLITLPTNGSQLSLFEK